MTMTQMGMLVLALILILLSMRFNLHKKLRKGLPGFLASTQTSLKRLVAGVIYRQVEVQGYDLAFLEGGKGETLLLLHGFGGDKDDWTPFLRRVRGKFRVVALDLPGFGESSRPSHNKHDVASQVRRLRAFKDKLDLPSVHLIGHHVGATIAGIYASLYPREALSLTMIEPFGVDPPVKSDVERLSSRGWSPLTAGTERDYGRVLSLLYHKPPKATSALQRQRQARAIEHQAFEEQTWKQMWENRPFLFEQILPEVKVRSLLFWGDRNKVAHVTGAKIVSQGIPEVTTVLLKNCGHMVMLERPKEVAQRFLKFVQGDPA
jgi:pimeloyl-ACP methyl ester carboxylesterase